MRVRLEKGYAQNLKKYVEFLVYKKPALEAGSIFLQFSAITLKLYC
jgi:hypothetical protein